MASQADVALGNHDHFFVTARRKRGWRVLPLEPADTASLKYQGHVHLQSGQYLSASAQVKRACSSAAPVSVTTALHNPFESSQRHS
tara:strand:- start:79 stop:336 length:258 start_codon:yes stop_codon:yes gene_type:complete